MPDHPSRLVLASASPRRLALLREIGLEPEVVPSRLPERGLPGELPRSTVRRLAEGKGRNVAARLQRDAASALILAADTEVVLGDRVLGKPRDALESTLMLRELRGRTHEVITAVFLLRTDDERELCEVETSRVRFREYDDRTIDEYVDGGEGADKAGGYAIQGQGARLAAGVEGLVSNVIGLPVERLAGWLGRIGVDLERLRLPRG